MDIFVARQPIFNKENEIFGYELLYRDGINNMYQNEDGDRATVEVIRNSILNIGINNITCGKKVFINFTENVIMSDILTVLPAHLVMIEILETVEPDEDILERCRRLKEIGFIFALDDFVFNDKYRRLIDIVDIIKVDFRVTKGYDRRKIMDLVKSKDIKFLAEKVETIEEFNEAVDLGYHYFQGYYLSKPIIISGKKLPENKYVYMNLLREINAQEFRVERIEYLIKKDVSLSYNLLKLINSSFFAFRNEIRSLRYALTILGEKEVKKWLYLIIVKTIGDDKPNVIIKTSLVRARFMELIASRMGFSNSCNAYLTGLLSMIDVLLDKPLVEVLDEIFIDNEVKEALVGSYLTKLGAVLKLVINYEAGQWDKVSEYSWQLDIDEGLLPTAYFKAIQWANNE
ncbi:MAG: HDOD domain-containing protein [Bacillota bacterium]|nr:HDOD domain-containing protein [Bacillota bacterium]